MSQITCISPVDGSTYAQVDCTTDAGVADSLAKARVAQRDWSDLSITQRRDYCTAAVDAMLAMGDEIVPELAWQMGRPVKFGAGELAGFE